MRNQLRLIALTLAGIFTVSQGPISVAASGQNVANISAATAEEYGIYAVVIQEMVLGKDSKTLVVLNATSAGYPPGMAASTSFGGSPDRKRLLEAAEQSTKSDFEAKTKQRVALECNPMKLGVRCVTLDEKEAEKALDANEGWKGFYKAYPASPGFLLLSRVGFNATHTQALLYYGVSCELLCGSGYFVLLSREADRWKVVDKAVLWVS